MESEKPRKLSCLPRQRALFLCFLQPPEPLFGMHKRLKPNYSNLILEIKRKIKQKNEACNFSIVHSD